MEFFLDQHVYTNVPAKKSPRRIGGFQTLCATDTLTARESEEILDRVIRNRTRPDLPGHLVFPLDSGRVAMATVTSLTDTDEFGRSGNFIAHTIIASSTDLADAGATPCTLLRQFQFFATHQSVLAMLRRTGGRLAARKIRAAPDTKAIEFLRKWSQPELLRLVDIGIHIAELSKQKLPIDVVGKMPAIRETLAALMISIPAQHACYCSFDTSTVGRRGHGSGSSFWAFRIRRRPVEGALVIDADRRAVVSTRLGDKASPYSLLLTKKYGTDSLKSFIADRQTSFQICQFLQQREFDHNSVVNADTMLIEETATMLEPHVRRFLESWAEGRLPELLATRFLEQSPCYTEQSFEEQSAEAVLIRRLATPDQDAAVAADVLYQFYFENFANGKLDTDEVRTVVRWVSRANLTASKLAALTCLWTGRRLAAALNALSAVDYSDFVYDWLRGSRRADSFFVDRHSGALAEILGTVPFCRELLRRFTQLRDCYRRANKHARWSYLLRSEDVRRALRRLDARRLKKLDRRSKDLDQNHPFKKELHELISREAEVSFLGRVFSRRTDK